MTKLFLFGLMGSGKTFAGKLLQRHLGFTFEDGDDYLTPAMKTAVSSSTQFTETMRDEYFAALAAHLRSACATNDRYVMSQAAYRQRHRHLLQSSVPNLELLWMDTPLDSCLARLRTPEQQTYARLIAPNFEPPPPQCPKIDADCNETELLRRITQFLESKEAPCSRE